MINELSYRGGERAAWGTFVKQSALSMMSFPKGAKGVPMAPPGAQPRTVAPPVAAPAAGAPAAGGGWKGMAKDVGVQMAVPLAMMGVQNMMTPTPPKDPNAVG